MEEKSFEQKILPYADSLFRFAKSILKNEEWAEDAVQDIFMKLVEKEKLWQKMDNPKPFLMRLMRNDCIDKWRCYHPTENIDENEHEVLDISNKLERKEILEIIEKFIAQLPELQRTVIHLRDIEGFEIKEIAEIMTMTENAVSANLSRARQKIKEKLMAMNIRRI